MKPSEHKYKVKSGILRVKAAQKVAFALGESAEL